MHIIKRILFIASFVYLFISCKEADLVKYPGIEIRELKSSAENQITIIDRSSTYMRFAYAIKGYNSNIESHNQFLNTMAYGIISKALTMDSFKNPSIEIFFYKDSEKLFDASLQRGSLTPPLRPEEVHIISKYHYSIDNKNIDSIVNFNLLNPYLIYKSH